jgi:hypothetical protein
MAKLARVVTLNLGFQTIGLAEFRPQSHGGLVPQNYRLRELIVDPAGDEMRPAQIFSLAARDAGRAPHSGSKSTY